MDTLQELAQRALRVDAAISNLEASVQTHKQFSNLQQELNHLQHAAPNCEAVVQARLKWYLYGLNNFNEHFIQPTVNHEEGWEDWHQNFAGYPSSAPGLFTHWETLQFFLKRHYLGAEGFFQCYGRFMDMHDAVIGAYRGNDRLQKFWRDRKELIHRMLMEGRL